MALWTPSELGASVVIWLKADTGVTESGGAVSAWANQAPSAASNFVQSTAGNKPALVAGSLGDAIRFDGSDDYLDGGTYAAYNGVEITAVALVHSDDVGSGTKAFLAVSDAEGGADAGWHMQASSDSGTVDFNASLRFGSSQLDAYRDDGNPGIVSGTVKSAVIQRVYWDGDPLIGADSADTYGGPAANRPAVVGARWTSDGPAYQNFYDGDVYEIVVCNRMLKAGEREQVEGYLSWKWATDGSLLVPDHTYYDAAPETAGGGGGLSAPIFGGLILR